MYMYIYNYTHTHTHIYFINCMKYAELKLI